MSEIQNNDVTADLVRDLLKEKRSDRRWKTARSLLWLALFAYVILSVVSHVGGSTIPLTTSGGNYVALIRLDGMIAPDRDFSAEQVVPLLHDAFADKNASGVVIDINSPGGTPVQASIIHDAILALSK